MKFKTDLTREPITVDTKAIAQGLFDEMFNENEKACLAFGLLPEAALKPVREYLGELATKFWPDSEVGFDIADANADRVGKERQRFVRDVERQICLDLYGVAPMVV